MYILILGLLWVGFGMLERLRVLVDNVVYLG